MMHDIIFEEEFKKRLTQLRLNKGVSSREMSLAIGQNVGYINNIECGKSLPSMSAFLFICDYLNISPKEFFALGSGNPEKIAKIDDNLKALSNEQLDYIYLLTKDLKSNK